MRIERYVSSFTRYASQYRGGWRIANIAERFFEKNDASGQTVEQEELIEDYDGDISLYVNRSSYMGRSVYWQGYYSAYELRALDSVLRPDMHFIDVGANEGLFALFAAKRLPHGTVNAFEPVSYVYERLLRNIEQNHFSNILVHNLGLADEPGNLTMYSSEGSDQDDMLSSMYRASGRTIPLETVKVETLDRFAEKAGISRVDVIKVDIEGAELPFLKGAVTIIESCMPKLIIEMNNESFLSAGYTQSDLIQFLEEREYTPYIIGARGKVVKASSDEMPPFCNVIFSTSEIN